MADDASPIAPQPAPLIAPAPEKVPVFSNHAKVSGGLVAGSATALLLSIAKSKFGLDLSNDAPNITILVAAIIGYIIR